MVKLQGKKVFILDRSRIIRDQLRGVLEKNGAEVQVDFSSDSALMRIIHWCPDLIIGSVEVGAITGFDLCLLLKLMTDYAAIPIIIISSGEKDVMQHRASDVGADFYVPKDKCIIENTCQIIDRLWSDQPQAAATQEESVQRQPGKVLLVDDSAVMRRIIRNMLYKMGVEEICEAVDGQEALKQLQKHHIGLVLTDWNMPVMNGLDFVRAVRRQPEFDTLPIIMVTTEAGKHERELASEAGVNKHLRKPFSNEKIREVIDQYSVYIHRNAALTGKKT